MFRAKRRVRARMLCVKWRRATAVRNSGGAPPPPRPPPDAHPARRPPPPPTADGNPAGGSARRVVATVAGARRGARGGRACRPWSDAGGGGPRPGGAATHLACLSPPLRAAARGLRAAPARRLVNRRGRRNVGIEQRQREAAPLPGDSPAARGAQRHTMNRCLTERTLMLLQAGEGGAEERAHLRACPRCTARHRALEDDLGVIADALRAGPPPGAAHPRLSWRGVGRLPPTALPARVGRGDARPASDPVL